MNKQILSLVLTSILITSQARANPLRRALIESSFSPTRLGVKLKERRDFSTAQDASVEDKKTVRILSIDGGGIRGLIPLTILDKIEKSTNYSISENFDIIAGSSTGGIVSLALNVANPDGTSKYSADALKDLYLKDNHTIFSQPYRLQRYLTPIWNFFAPKYSSDSLEELLKEKFGDTLLSESKSTTLVTACNLRNSRLHVFNSYEAINSHENNYYMRDIARATSAAPTYFSPFKISPHFRDGIGIINKYQVPLHLIDGGIAANNPTFIAYSYARTFFPEANDYLLVSLGTGTRTVGFTKYSELKGVGFWGWARKLPRLMINSSSSVVEHYIDVLRAELARNPHTSCRYYAFRPELPEDLSAMDSTCKSKNKDLIDYAAHMIESDPYKTQLANLIDELKPKRNYAFGSEKRILRPGFSLTKTANDNISAEAFIDSLKAKIGADIGLQRKPLSKKEAERIEAEAIKQLRLLGFDQGESGGNSRIVE